MEFVIFTDYFGASPHYFITEIENTVAIITDGRAEVLPHNAIRVYQARTFANDYSEFMESIHNLRGEYNTVMKLVNK